MALPKATIIIHPDGRSSIEGNEKSDTCFKLSDLAKGVGKVESEKAKDHAPVKNVVTTKRGAQ